MTKAIERTDLPGEILARLQGRERVLIAIAAAPGAGKSTLAAALKAQVDAELGAESAAVLPMDGFHLDNAVLVQRGLLERKGAPETFDAAGLVALIGRLRREAEVVIPLFDRSRDLAVAGAAVVEPRHRVVLVEGNYLLLDRAPWDTLAPLWDLSVWLDVPLPVLEARLVGRWLDHGLTPEAARARALGNDIPNARLVLEVSRAADLALPCG
jgi:pantothenate kinase